MNASSALHKTAIVVRFSEIDPYGFAWHGRYLDWLECGRNDYTRHFGFDPLASVHAGYRFPMTSFSIKYRSPARFNDRLWVETWLQETPLAKIVLSYRILGQEDGRLVASARSEQVVINESGELLLRLPAATRDLLAAIFAYQSGVTPAPDR